MIRPMVGKTDHTILPAVKPRHTARQMRQIPHWITQHWWNTNWLKLLRQSFWLKTESLCTMPQKKKYDLNYCLEKIMSYAIPEPKWARNVIINQMFSAKICFWNTSCVGVRVHKYKMKWTDPPPQIVCNSTWSQKKQKHTLCHPNHEEPGRWRHVKKFYEQYLHNKHESEYAT